MLADRKPGGGVAAGSVWTAAVGFGARRACSLFGPVDNLGGAHKLLMMRAIRIALFASAVGFLAAAVHAQRGDRAGEEQAMLPDSVAVPAAVVRTPVEELQTFHLPKGFEATLFAAEPMVQDPVVATWDGEGRMWVCEFTSYMKDIEATDEDEPSGRIVALHGVRGSIEVDGKTWDLEMPGQGHLSDAELAQVLSYLRRAFGHKASCVDRAAVTRERRRAKKRSGAWTAAELLGKK